MSGRSLLRHVLAGVVVMSLAASSAAGASAHAELTGSTPSPGAVLDTAPAEVVLTFDHELSDESTFTVEDGEGLEVGWGELDLDVIDRNVLRGAVEIAGPGSFTVSWSATDAVDGDITSGQFSFTVRGAGSAASPGAAASPGPNTAVDRGSRSRQSATLVGLLLVTAGGLVAVGVRARRHGDWPF